MTIFCQEFPIACQNADTARLGHVITDDLKDDNDIARQYKRIYAQGNALIRKFYMCSDHVKCTLFRSLCTSLYTCQLWCNHKSESIRKLYVAYNNRAVFNVLLYVHVMCIPILILQ